MFLQVSDLYDLNLPGLSVYEETDLLDFRLHSVESISGPSVQMDWWVHL